MSVESARIARAYPHVLEKKSQVLLKEEVCKGCTPHIYPTPVSLEPEYTPIAEIQGNNLDEFNFGYISENPPNQNDLRRYRIWLSPQEEFDWDRSELFLKQLASITYRAGFEITGNHEQIHFCFLCHKNDHAILEAAFHGQYLYSRITPSNDRRLLDIPNAAWETSLFCDYFPSPPYSHLLTQPHELHISPLESFLRTLASLPSPAVALMQVLFQPVSPHHNWHRNVEIIQDLEYKLKLLRDPQYSQRYEQQVPSGDLRQMSLETESKAHNDKPFFSVAYRILLINANGDAGKMFDAMYSISNLYQHGGRPLNALAQNEYIKYLPPHRIKEMFHLGLTYRPGFLVNSRELTGLVHLPASTILDQPLPIEKLETLPPLNGNLSKGSPIGECHNAGDRIPICIPPNIRSRSTHTIGRPGMGKTTTMEHMILNDIKEGYGAAVFDPHGDLVERILCLIPESAINRTIYFDPGDPEHVPMWNPLTTQPGEDLSRKTDDLVSAIKNIVTGWGDRLEHLLRNIFYGLLHLPGATMFDALNLMSFKSDNNKHLQNAVLDVIENETARMFWEKDLTKYGKDDLGPPKNKLSKLLLTDTVARMLSQPENRINFRKIMDEGYIFLINLSSIGVEVRAVLGSFLLSLFHLATLSRQDTLAHMRKPFHLFLDEAHIFITGAIDNLIAESRKYGVNLTLAHQYMSQFPIQKVDALSNIGSTIIFNVDSKDANRITKDLRGLVSVDDITSLEIGEAITRIGTEIVRIKTFPALSIPQKHFKNQILEHSFQEYYRNSQEVQQTIRERYKTRTFDSELDAIQRETLEKSFKNNEELIYDEFN
jgi:hypothetical protein